MCLFYKGIKMTKKYFYLIIFIDFFQTLPLKNQKLKKLEFFFSYLTTVTNSSHDGIFVFTRNKILNLKKAAKKNDLVIFSNFYLIISLKKTIIIKIHMNRTNTFITSTCYKGIR